ncbi:hypothetical protein CT0861_12573 [Colletotrichum tofieldiae]|uniref:Uncharacterized protein n=1 Tax=Colletotrichum tofieldiae TaxID=708197 RepID=A0A166RDU3_9PEZI|nr:hypothetical protein CT0861_12573 [Colletotrichum tofieldiae]
MGSVCGKEDKGDNFTSPGRPLGTAPPPQPKTAPIPARVGGPPRTLGGGSGGGAPGEQSANAAEARRKAAEAAEVGTPWPSPSPSPPPPMLLASTAHTANGPQLWRNRLANVYNPRQARAKAASKSTGKLSSQLNAQKKQTQADLLKDASAQQLRQRDADAAAEARTYN